MRRARTTLAAALAAALALAACGGEREDAATGEGGRLSIATGNTTGVYYVLGGGLARLIGDGLPGYSATAEVTGASVENIQRVVKGDSEIAFTLADTAADAAGGKGAFDGPQPIRALARIYTNYTHVLVRTDAGISSIEDMKGKSVSTGSANSGTEVIAAAAAHRGRPRPGRRRQAAEAVAAGDRAGHEGRRHPGHVLVRRAAHRRHHRPGHLAGRQGPLPRPVRVPAEAAGRVRRGLPGRDDRAGHLPAVRAGAEHRRAQPAGGQGHDERRPRLQADRAALHPAGGPGEGAPGGEQHQA